MAVDFGVLPIGFVFNFSFCLIGSVLMNLKYMQ